MNIVEIRQKYPQYSDVSDEELLRGLHRKHYSDMDYEEFRSKIDGASQEPAESPAPVTEPPTEPERYLYNENGTVAGINPEAAPTKEESRRYIRGGGQALLRGQLMGGGDEFAAATRAVLDRVFPTEADRLSNEIASPNNRTIADDYQMYRQDELASRDQFAKENPKTAIAAEVVGGIASPVNQIASGVGMTGGPLSRAVALAARGAAEGGVTGFLEGDGDIEDRLANAHKVAKTGAALGGAISGVGGVLGRTLSNRRIERELLDETGNFMPLNMAAPETTIGKLYRNVVGLAYGGGGEIGKQESRYLNRALKMRRFANSAGEVVEEAQGTRRMVDKLKDGVENQARSARQALDTNIAAAKYKPPARTIKEATEAGMERSRAAMRAEQAKRAVPPHAPDELKDIAANETNPSVVAKKLDQWWQKNGFAGVKAHQFELDDELYNFLKRNLDPEADAHVIDMLDEMMDAGGGSVSGKFLMELRNQPARASASAGDWRRGKLRMDVDKFNKIIRKKLREDGNDIALNQFNTDLNYYGEKEAYVRALDKSLSGPNRTPYFDESHLSVAGLKRQRRYGEAAGQELAASIGDEKRALKKTLVAQQRASKDASERQVNSMRHKKHRVDQQERAAKNRLDNVKVGMLPEDSTFWSRGAATLGLGALPSGFGVAAFPAGVAAAATLAQPTTQRAVAGQLDIQKALAKALREGDTARVTQILTRVGALQGAKE